MRRTTSGLRAGSGIRVDSLAAERPEFRLWFELLELVGNRMSEPVWSAAAGSLALAPDPPRAAGAPLLHDREIQIPAGSPGALVRELFARATRPEDDRPRVGRTLGDRAAVGLLEAVLADDAETIASLSAALEIEDSRLRAVSTFALVPLLSACARELESRTEGWTGPQCPICGAWPTLVEVRGLDRARRARCGRCGTGWHSPRLRCIYCGESDHEKLGYLAGPGESETRRAETCRTCRGYLKVITSLAPASTTELWLRDLETLELDIVALERDYTRPDRPGRPIRVRLADRTGPPGAAPERSARP